MRAWNTLNEGIQDKDAEHRKKALAAIGTIGSVPRAVKLAEAALADKNLLVRQAAATALGDPAGLLAKDWNPYSLALLEWSVNADESVSVRVAVAKALGERGNRGTIARLAPHLDDEHHEVRYMGAASIIRLSLKS